MAELENESCKKLFCVRMWLLILPGHSNSENKSETFYTSRCLHVCVTFLCKVKMESYLKWVKCLLFVNVCVDVFEMCVWMCLRLVG